jgi:hypothetical protein
MRNTLRLCIKDFSHLWPYVAFLWFVVVLRAVTDMLMPNHVWLLFLHENIFPIATYLPCFLIAALAVHDDPLTGDRQFWLTRPISWKDLLAGKILFLVFAIHAPVLIAQSAAMLVYGFSPLHRLPILAEQQLTLLVFLAVVAVFASVTRTLAQIIILAMAAGIVLIATKILLDPMFIGDWDSAQTMRFWIYNTPLALIALFLIWLQYFRRIARCVIPIIFILIIIGASFNDRVFAHFWHSTARYRAQQDGVLRNQTPKVSFLGSPTLHYKRAVGNVTGRDVAGFVLPVQIAGIPEGHGLISEWINFIVIAPDGSTWESGWKKRNGIYKALYAPGENLLLTNGENLIVPNVDGKFYQRIQDKSVRVRIALAFRLVGPPAPVILQKDRLSPILNGEGLCGPPRDQSKLPVCLFNKRPSAVFFFKNGDVPLGNSEAGTSIWGYRTATIYSSVNFQQPAPLPQPSEDQLSVRREEAWFETILDIPQINLSDYLSARFPK